MRHAVDIVGHTWSSPSGLSTFSAVGLPQTPAANRVEVDCAPFVSTGQSAGSSLSDAYSLTFPNIDPGTKDPSRYRKR
jgi:hypothetical protein